MSEERMVRQAHQPGRLMNQKNNLSQVPIVRLAHQPGRRGRICIEL